MHPRSNREVRGHPLTRRSRRPRGAIEPGEPRVSALTPRGRSHRGASETFSAMVRQPVSDDCACGGMDPRFSGPFANQANATNNKATPSTNEPMRTARDTIAILCLPAARPRAGARSALHSSRATSAALHRVWSGRGRAGLGGRVCAQRPTDPRRAGRRVRSGGRSCNAGTRARCAVGRAASHLDSNCGVRGRTNLASRPCQPYVHHTLGPTA